MRYATHSKHLMVAVLFAAPLLLMGLVPPQEAQSQEKTPQNSQEKNAPAEDNNAQEERLKDKDPKGNEVASGELLVSYRRGAFKEAADKAPKEAGGRVEKDYPEIEVQLVSFPEVKNQRTQQARQQALERKKEALEPNPNVEAVDYNYVEEASWTPNDPDFGQQWGYKKIRAEGAWDHVWGNPGFKVAVIDSGIWLGHDEFQDQVAAQRDFVNDDDFAMDDNGHGTHVAGTVAAETNNDLGVAGTCPTCTLLIAKTLGADKTGLIADRIEATSWAVSNGADVINMSLGKIRPPSEAEERSINDAWDKGVVLVASAGNDGTNGPAEYPAAYQNVIAVAATDQNDQRASFSNAGDWVDVAAPGVNIYSTLPTWSYGNYSGTSMAAPHVSGLAGLLVSKGYSNSEVRKRIESTTVDLGRTGKDPVYGSGLIDAQAAFVCFPDTCPPDAKHPARSFAAPSALGTSTIPVKLNWSATDRGGSGIARYELQQSTNGGTYANVSLASAMATSTTPYLAPNNTYRFRVRAQDSVGNWSTWMYGESFRVGAYQEDAATYSGTWSTRTALSGAYGGYVKSTTSCSATAKLSFTGSNVAWVATKGPNRGKAEVWVDGVKMGTYNLYAATAQARQMVYAKGGLDPSKSHTIEIKKALELDPDTFTSYCSGNSVDVDVFAVLNASPASAINPAS